MRRNPRSPVLVLSIIHDPSSMTLTVSGVWSHGRTVKPRASLQHPLGRIRRAATVYNSVAFARSRYLAIRSMSIDGSGLYVSIHRRMHNSDLVDACRRAIPSISLHGATRAHVNASPFAKSKRTESRIRVDHFVRVVVFNGKYIPWWSSERSNQEEFNSRRFRSIICSNGSLRLFISPLKRKYNVSDWN